MYEFVGQNPAGLRDGRCCFRSVSLLGGAGIEVCGMAPLRGAESLSQTLSLLRPTHTKVSSAHKILRDYYTIKYNLSTYWGGQRGGRQASRIYRSYL